MPIYRSSKPDVLVTMGDPSGIGPEVVLRSLASPEIQRLANFFIIGSSFVLEGTRKRLKLRPFLHKVLDLDNISPHQFRFGRVDKRYGRASIEYLEKALSMLKKDRTAALVTAPISKESINMAGFRYGGHTEFLAESTKTRRFAMMLMGGPLRVVLVTRHISMREVPRSITGKKIIEAIGLAHGFLARYLCKKHPKIAVTSLNPHGGEGGILGNEDKRIIAPAVNKARKRYRNLLGPMAPEAVFYEAYRGRVDGVICMYHDQALIPLKMIARDAGVNVTLGLPFVRTSPGHGTAFDIAGKGAADPSSMKEAIRVAVRLVKARC